MGLNRFKDFTVFLDMNYIVYALNLEYNRRMFIELKDKLCIISEKKYVENI